MAVFRVNGDKGTIARVSSPTRRVIRVTASPRGPVGPRGEQGVPGPQGEVGPQGNQGPQGDPGDGAYTNWLAEGNVGTVDDFLATLVGPEGPEGPQGPAGNDGAQGPQGPAGADGNDGAPGATGPAGANGADGTDGEDGASAYEIAVANGFSGTEEEWLESLVGPEGPEGPQGPQGDPGPAGSGTGDMLASVYDPDGGARQVAFQDELGGGGVTDHGALTGLGDDDHTQYHNDTRGDARYYTKSQVDTSLSGKSNTGHTHTAANVTDFDTEVSNNTDVAANTAARHSHSNKALLDTYTQTEADIADAISKEHTHSNKSTLDATTASFTTADETKLDGIEAGADVTDTANVTAAGALMDSELADLSAVKTLQAPDNTTISTFGASLADDATASDARTTLGLGNVDNTSDANKPVSTATQTELDTKAERIDMRAIERFTKGSGGFDVTITNAIQGVAFDGTHYYVTTKSHIYKYDTGGSLVTSHANSGDANTHKYLGDLVVVGGVLFVASANFDGSPGTFNTYVVRFNASDLTYISETQISTTDRCDSITYHDGEFWCPMYGKTIRRFDSSWNFVAEYTMPIGNWEIDPSANGIGFDGATWVDNYMILNPHEGIYPDCAYVLYFNGTTFERIAQIDRPIYCTQGIDYVPSTGQVVAAERNTASATWRVTLMNIRTEIPARSEWKELRRFTLETSSDTITVKDLPNRRYLKIVCGVTTTGGTANVAFRFNNDSGTKYSRMRSVQMAAGSSALSQTSIGVGATNADTQLIIGEILNIVGTSKIGYFTASQTVDNSGATAPSNITVTGKYADTSSSIDRIDVLNTAGTGDFAAGSQLVVYGRD
jgi:hypothetical protein